VPADGTFINTNQDGAVYRIAGGAPIYVSTWDTYGGPQPTVGVDKWAVDNPTHPAAHLRPVPADGTFINTNQDGAVYRIAGGAPIYVSTWSIYGGPQPTVGLDKWAVDNRSHPAAHMRAVPADGTLVEGLPSHSFWTFNSGHRGLSTNRSGAVGVDDAGLAAFPLPSPPNAGSDSGGTSSGNSGSTSNENPPTRRVQCVVPRLKKKTLRQAKRALKQGHCRLGKVRRPPRTSKQRVARVTRQSARPRTRHGAGFRVDVTLSS
jgi:hypothetical protein